MEKLNYEFPYKSVKSVEELSEADQALVEACKNATANAHAPYSKFRVGAALKLSNEKIVTGSNQENAAYPSGLCAERVALFAAAHTYPGIAATALAISAFDNGNLTPAPVTPCGGCRQVMAEFIKQTGSGFRLILVGKDCIFIFDNALQLLPFHFS